MPANNAIQYKFCLIFQKDKGSPHLLGTVIDICSSQRDRKKEKKQRKENQMNEKNAFTGVRREILSQKLSLIMLSAFALFAFLLPGKADAAGLLIADGGFGGVLEIKEHDVRVIINNGIAVTHVTQVFQNTENRQVEALYTFPVPRGASVANFTT